MALGTREPAVRLATALRLRVHVEAALRWQPGSGARNTLVLAGSVRLPEIRAAIQFHESDGGHGSGGNGAGASQSVAVIVPRATMIACPDQNLAIPARKPCDVWMSTPAPGGESPWIERYGGLLGDEPLGFETYLLAAMTLEVAFTAGPRPDGGGFGLNFEGEMRLDQSLPMRLQFRDPRQSMASTSESPGHESVLLAAGARIPIPRQPVSRLSAHGRFMTPRVIEAPGIEVLAVP